MTKFLTIWLLILSILCCALLGSQLYDNVLWEKQRRLNRQTITTILDVTDWFVQLDEANSNRWLSQVEFNIYLNNFMLDQVRWNEALIDYLRPREVIEAEEEGG